MTSRGVEPEKHAARICVIGVRGFPLVIGGIESHCEHLYPRVLARIPEIEIHVLGRSGYVDPDAARPRGLHVMGLWAPHTQAAEALVHTLIATVYAIVRVRPRLIHFHGIGPGFFCLLTKLFRIPTVVTHHARDYARPKWGLLARAYLRLAEATLARFADRIVCVSSVVEQELVDKYPVAGARTVVIRSGSALGAASGDGEVLRAHGLTPGGYVLAVGRIDATKGFHDLIDAFELANPPGKMLVIVGSAIYSDDYTRAIMARRSDRVRFVGYQSGEDLRRLYQDAALFVHPSYMEGYGLVVIEALSTGVPVIVSDIAVHREFNLPRAAHFAPGDVAAMARMLASESYDAFRPPNLEAILDENNWEECVSRHVAVFERAMQSPTTRPARPLRPFAAWRARLKARR